MNMLPMSPRTTLHQPSGFTRPPTWTTVAVMALVLTLYSCRITDHSERDADVGTEHLNFPVTGEGQVDPKDLPQITFDSTHADMGRIAQGSKVDRTFTFTNTGGGALVITDVRGSCGCTVGKDWPKTPVKPGEKASISVTFDSEGRSGRQDKTVTIVANTVPPSHVLTLSGDVIGPATTAP